MFQGPETSVSSITLTARPRVFCRVVGETRGTTHARHKRSILRKMRRGGCWNLHNTCFEFWLRLSFGKTGGGREGAREGAFSAEKNK